MRRLDRYLMREITGPLALGFLVYTFILLLDALFDLADMIIRRGLPFSTVGELLLLSLPNIVVLTIPMSLLFGTLIAIGRLSSDSELVALRACGVSLLTLYRPILIISAVLTLINTLLMVYVLPWGNHRLQIERLDIMTQSVSSQVEPRVFYEDFPNYVLYVFETPDNDERWRGVFLSEAIPSTRSNTITTAEWGRVKLEEGGERVVLELTGAVVHEMDLTEPERYNISRHDRLEVVLEDRFVSSQRAEIVASKGVRELTIPELARWSRDTELPPSQRRLARVEIHKKFSIPFACIVFGIFALPLGFNNRRGGKASGFALSILVILVYWILLDTGEESAAVGRLPPWVAMWGPNILLSVAGFFLLARRNRDKSLLLTRFDRWLRNDVWQRLSYLDRRFRRRREERREERLERRRAANNGGGDGGSGGGRTQVLIRLPRFQLRFPNLLDRYVTRVFSQVFLMVLASGVTIYIVADLTGKADEIFKNQVPKTILYEYYKYLSLQIFYQIGPILVLVTTLITFALLSRSNEVTAAKALGVSLYRLSLAAVVAALAITLFSGFLEAQVLPAANQRVAQLKDVIKGKEGSRTYRRADRQWLFGQGRYIYNYLHYDQRTQALQRLQVFEFSPEYRLTARLVTARADFLPRSEGDGAWIFSDGWVRRFDGPSLVSFQRFEEPVVARYPEQPEYFDSEILPPEQLPYRELKRYIRELESSGQSVPELKVQLQNKIAYPTISLIMALVALPFAFRLGRQGALYGVGFSIILGMVFFIVYSIFSTIGEAGLMPPAVAVWSPNVIVGLWAVYLFLGVRT